MNTPGVSIQEISTLPVSIAAVETAIPAFIGYTKTHDQHASVNLDAAPVSGATPTKPIRISSLKEYVDLYGGSDEAGFTQIEVNDDYTDSVLTSRTVNVTFQDDSMYQSMKLFFANGGGQCYIISVGLSSATKAEIDFKNGIDAIKKEDEPTLIVFPQASELGNTGVDHGDVIKHALAQCNKLQDRFVIADVSNDFLDIDSTVSQKPQDFRAMLGTEYLNYGALYYPSVKTSIDYAFADTDVQITNHAVTGTGTLPTAIAASTTLETIRTADTGIYNAIQAKIATTQTTVPVSGAIAGVYAAVDSDRGVWKAPANVALSNVIAPTYVISDLDQKDLNVDVVAGKSINAVRVFTGKGNIVWGSRTLAGNDNEWRYVNVRRLFIFVEESIKKAMESYVFEPNTAQTWIKLKGGIENFLTDLWRQGGLTGSKATDAYFVNIGLGSTMTSQDILEGKLNIEIGLAAARPAEFIILKFSQQQQVS